MMIALTKIEFSSSFSRKLKRLKKQNPRIAKQLSPLLKIFQRDAFHPKLKTHKLGGELTGRYAFSVAPNFRIIFRWVDSTTVILVDLGTHDQVYR